MKLVPNRSVRSSLISALAFLGSVALAGCGNLTAGGVGEASVAMSGDAPEDTTAPQASAAAPTPQWSLVSDVDPAASTSSGPEAIDADLDDPEGQFEADLTVYLIDDAGNPVAITDGEVEVRLDLEGVEEPEIGSRTVPATGYPTLRMVFTDIEVQVDAGLVINGVPVTGPIEVRMEDLTFTVDKAVAIEIGDGERVELLIDLNADSWLQAVDPTAVPPTVDAQVFGDLVTVRVR